MIFVTGASGFIGTHLCRALQAAQLDFIAFGGRRASPFQGKLINQSDYSDPRIEEGDISQFARLAERFMPDVILHLAALANTAGCEAAPQDAKAANAELVYKLIALCPKASHIYVSTDLVFEAARSPAVGFNFLAEPHPVSVYAQTKRAGEQYTLNSNSKNMVARICLTYGAELMQRRCFIHWMVDTLKSGIQLKLFSDEYRTAVFVGDVVDGLIALSKIVLDNKPCAQRIFHFAGPDRLSRYEFGEVLAKKLNLDSDLLESLRRDQMPLGVFRAADVSLDARASWNELGIKPRSIFELEPRDIA